jgi:hypothetical protein
MDGVADAAFNEIRSVLELWWMTRILGYKWSHSSKIGSNEVW